MFIAPEMDQDSKYNQKIDLWGVGCILCYLLHKKIPNNGNNSSNGPEASPAVA